MTAVPAERVSLELQQAVQFCTRVHLVMFATPPQIALSLQAAVDAFSIYTCSRVDGQVVRELRDLRDQVTHAWHLNDLVMIQVVQPSPQAVEHNVAETAVMSGRCVVSEFDGGNNKPSSCHHRSSLRLGRTFS